MNSDNPSPRVHIGPFIEVDSSLNQALNKEKFTGTPPISPLFLNKIEDRVFSPTHLTSPKRKAEFFNPKKPKKNIQEKEEEKELRKKIYFF